MELVTIDYIGLGCRIHIVEEIQHFLTKHLGISVYVDYN